MRVIFLVVALLASATNFNFSLFAKKSTEILAQQKQQFKTLIKKRIEDSKGSGILDLSGLVLKNLDILLKLSDECYKKAKEIRLNNNRIERIPADIFSRFSKLEFLDLSNNQISSIDGNALLGCKNLTVLYLANNNLTNLPPNFLFDQKKLEVFDVSDNSLQVLGKNLFKNCKNLKKVNLADNQLRFISPNLFAGKKLDEINIQGNKFEALGVLGGRLPGVHPIELDMW